MERSCYVFIYLPGELQAVPAGLFSYDSVQRVGLFQYGRRYLERPNAIAVDPAALPLGVEPRMVETNDGLYGALRDSSPDYWGRTVIAAEKRVAASALDEIDFLLAANASRVGNLDFRTELDGGEPAYAPPTFQALDDLLEASRLLQESMPVRRDLQQLLVQGSSIGGARPKCTVEWDGGLWIAKFPSKGDDFSNARIEHATMTLAGQCGITVPETRVMDIGGREVLMVRRFDREAVPGGYSRHGMVSALSFMEWDQGDRGAFSYVAIAERMRQVGLAATGATEELYVRMLFNMFCRNTDDHPRNHAFLVKGDQLELSPAYDITPSASRPGVGTDFSLVMDIGQQGRHATIENAISRHASFGLGHDHAVSLVRRVAAVVAGWERHFESSGVASQDVEKFRGSFESPLQDEVALLPGQPDRHLRVEGYNGPGF